ncbi:stearoyl-CoA 9-desaturase [Sarracenia purpurea var. burkii]
MGRLPASPMFTPFTAPTDDFKHRQAAWRSGVVLAALFRDLIPLQQGPIPFHLINYLVRSIKRDHYVSDTGDINYLLQLLCLLFYIGKCNA